MIHICIYSFHGDRFLDDCMKSIHDSRGHEGYFIDLYVYSKEGLFRDEYGDLNKGNAEVTVLREQKNFSWVTNRSIEKATRLGHESVLLLNSDTILHPDCLRSLSTALSSIPRLGIAGGYQTEYEGAWDEPNQWTKVTVKKGPGDDIPGKFYPTSYVQGACMMFKTSLAEDIGAFDERFELFYEETEFCRRATRRGFSVGVIADARVKHYGGGTWKKNPSLSRKRDVLYLSNQIIFESTDAPVSGLRVLSKAVGIIKKQARQVIAGGDNLTISIFLYPLVLFSLIRRWRLARDLYLDRGLTQKSS